MSHETRLELTEYLTFDVLMRAVIVYLILTLVFSCALLILFPDVWWLWSWKPF